MFAKLQPGDKVGIVSPSFGAAAQWPLVYELGLRRIREDFGLVPVEFPTTRAKGAARRDRAGDLIDAFRDPSIKAVIATLGGDDQVTYVKFLSSKSFIENPKPFFGFSDNTHFANFLWRHNIPSYYGGAVLTQFGQAGAMDEFTVRYLRYALFEGAWQELLPAPERTDLLSDWNDPVALTQRRIYEPNEGWYWDGAQDGLGRSWGGCLESIDDILRTGGEIPSLEEFRNVVLFLETCEELNDDNYVYHVLRALGERGILESVRGILIGRPQAWFFGKEWPAPQREEYRRKQRAAVLKAVREYNPSVSVVQNLDFGHTNPQIALPYGRPIHLDAGAQRIFAEF